MKKVAVLFMAVSLLASLFGGCRVRQTDTPASMQPELPTSSPARVSTPPSHTADGIITNISAIGDVSKIYTREEGLGHVAVRSVAVLLVTKLLDDLKIEKMGRSLMGKKAGCFFQDGIGQGDFT